VTRGKLNALKDIRVLFRNFRKGTDAAVRAIYFDLMESVCLVELSAIQEGALSFYVPI